VLSIANFSAVHLQQGHLTHKRDTMATWKPTRQQLPILAKVMGC